MIVQTAEDGAPRFAVPMAEHMALATQMARAFGNAEFEPVPDREELRFAIENHDAGWAEVDARFPIDPETGYPFHLGETPFDLLMATSRGSPDFNEAHHPFSGLLSSMHSWGLYNGRYGLSDMVLLDRVAAEHAEAARAMLAHEQERQARLKARLRDDPDLRELVEEPFLTAAYKLLQCFDTFALYFNCVHEGARKAAVFRHVPKSAAEDADVAVAPLGGGRYGVRPYPFSESPLTLDFGGRYVARLDGTGTPDMAALPLERQTVALEAA